MPTTLVEYPDDRLRAACRPVDMRDLGERSAVKQLALTLIDTMRSIGAWSLHAAQLCEPVQVFVVAAPGETRVPVVFVNATVQTQRGVLVRARERCASFPTCSLLVPRAPYVTVRRLNENGVVDFSEWHGWTARLIQHEVEHDRGDLVLARGRNKILAWRAAKRHREFEQR